MKKTLTCVYAMLLLLSINACDSTAQDDNSTKSFPYKYVTSKREEGKPNDGSYNEMTLYVSGPKVNVDTLKMFCKMKKDSISDGYFHIITFFIDKEHAKLVNHPVTSMYGLDEDLEKNIKATYTYNLGNGYSKLTVYDKNSFESKPIEYDIN